MRLSTSTNICFNRPGGIKADITESVRRCAEAGYRVMDLNFHDCTTFRLPFVTDGWEKWIDGIAAVAAELGVTFNQSHASFYNFCDSGYQNREFMDAMILRAVKCSGFLKIPYVVIHAGTDYSSSSMRRSSAEKNREYFKPVIEYASQAGTSIVFENLWDLNIAPRRRFTADIEDLVEFADSFSGAPVGICYDTDHGTLMQQDPEKSLQLIGDRLVATHISDCISVECDHILPYSGKSDWEKITRAFRTIGYKGDLTYEVHRYTQNLPDELMDSALRHSIDVGEYLIRQCRENKTGGNHDNIG